MWYNQARKSGAYSFGSKNALFLFFLYQPDLKQIKFSRFHFLHFQDEVIVLNNI